MAQVQTDLEFDVLKYVADGTEFKTSEILDHFTKAHPVTEIDDALRSLDRQRLIRSRMEALTKGPLVYQITRDGQLLVHSNSPPEPREEGSSSPPSSLPRSATSSEGLTALGQTVREWGKKLEVFPAPPGLTQVKMVGDEFTALCPITNQPDYYILQIDYVPRDFCIESKSLKLYLGSYRNEGGFVEALASKILTDVVTFAEPSSAVVSIIQKSRGGITIVATSEFSRVID